MSNYKKVSAVIAICSSMYNYSAFARDFKDLDSIQNEYTRREADRSVVFGYLKTGTSLAMIGVGAAAAAGSFGVLAPATIPLTTLGVTGVVSGLDILSQMVSSEQITEQYNAFIFKVYKNDSDAFKVILSEKDDVKRSQLIFNKISELNDYKNLIPSDPAKRSIYNSTAIIKIIEVTKGLAAENIEQSNAIRKLEANYNSLKSKMDNPEKRKLLISYNENALEASKNLAETTKNASRAVASIDGATAEELKDPKHPKVVTPKAATFKENYEKFHSTLEQTLFYYQGAYQIAVNLGLNGKDQERMAKGMMYLNTAFSISKAYVTMNPQDIMGAAINVTSLFGKKQQVDPKHEAIMASFGKLFETQALILKNQAEIYNLQIKNYELLVSLYEYSQKEFIKLEDGLDLILGGQAVLQKQVVDYSSLSPKLDACDAFLNSRIVCPPSDFEDADSLLSCVKRSAKTNFEIPHVIYTNTLYGQYMNLSEVEEHLKSNFDSYNACQSGMADLFPSKTSGSIHSAFLTSVVVENGKTGYQEIVSKNYLPLLDLTKIFYRNNNDLFLFYLLISNPSPSLNQFSYKLMSASHWLKTTEIDKVKALSGKQVLNALENLIYVPNLEKYVVTELQMLPYMQYVPSNFNMSSSLDPNFLAVGLKNSSNSRIADRLFSLEKLVNIAIAQQTLLSGEPFIDKVDYLLQDENIGTREQNAILKLLRNNSFFRLNYLKLVLRNFLGYSFNRNPNLDYAKQFDTNLKSYREYVSSGFRSCESKKCNEPIFLELNKKFKLEGNRIRFNDRERGDFLVELPDADFLSTSNLEHTAELKRLFTLRSIIENKIYESSKFTDIAINQNYYTF